MSPQAREAYERAQARGEYRTIPLQMVDVGVIAAQSGSDGLVMRRTRSISKDDDGARPFVTLAIPPEEADRNARFRFELMDHNGKQQYVRDMTVFLRDGEMNVLADTHLPLMGNEHISGMGDWDLRVYIDDVLVGVHGFQLTPSIEERQQRVERGDDDRRRRLQDRGSGSQPMSLEDLLRNQDQERR
jgi:hypothetical protein